MEFVLFVVIAEILLSMGTMNEWWWLYKNKNKYKHNLMVLLLQPQTENVDPMSLEWVTSWQIPVAQAFISLKGNNNMWESDNSIFDILHLHRETKNYRRRML